MKCVKEFEKALHYGRHGVEVKMNWKSGQVWRRETDKLNQFFHYTRFNSFLGRSAGLSGSLWVTTIQEHEYLKYSVLKGSIYLKLYDYENKMNLHKKNMLFIV